MGLKQRTVDEILEDSLDGKPPSHEELRQLCELAVTGHMASERCDALEAATIELGYFIIDMTTDDDDGLNLELHPIEDDV